MLKKTLKHKQAKKPTQNPQSTKQNLPYNICAVRSSVILYGRSLLLSIILRWEVFKIGELLNGTHQNHQRF